MKTTMETAHDGETINAIQTYLDTFNKEIQNGDQPSTPAEGTFTRKSGLRSRARIIQTGSPAVATQSSEGSEGTFYVDQATGQYYYQATDDPQQQVISVLPDSGDGQDSGVSITDSDSVQETTFVAMQPQESQEEESAIGMDAQQEEQEPNNQVILNTGDAYQTVTIVPSDTNPGEVSYVLIVQQPDDKEGEKSDDQDLTVYDFDEGEEGAAMDSGEETDDKSKIVKIMPKKSQTVTQAHMCNYCNYTSPKRYLLSRHMKSHSEERPHKCSVCERGFKTLASLQNHVNTHTGTKPHRCKFCDSAFTTSGELVRHVRYRHTHEKPHRCTECDYASVELSKLKRHMRCHTGERPYQCPHCTYASPDTFKLKRHLRIHTGEKPYECDICHARFTQSNSLKAHKLIHTGNKPVYQCELCPTTCGRKTDLRIHVQKLHTSDKPLKCKRCGKSFPDRYTYKLHNKTHEGEKCFKCDLCPYASISQRHLESHMLIHTDQKPYQCDQCDQVTCSVPIEQWKCGMGKTASHKSFRQKQLLKRHQNLYHNPNYIPPLPKEKTHECPECGRSFRHKGNLIRHMAIHDPDSATQEKALALKLGRQKKIQIIDGQQVEVMPGEEEEEEDEPDGEMVAMEGQDGQQYVVLEVIQLQDGDGQEQAVAVVTNSDGSGTDAVEQAVAALHQDDAEDVILGEPQHITPDHDLTDDETTITIRGPKARIITQKSAVAIQKRLETQKDMQNCFGFDEDEDDDGDDMQHSHDSEDTAKTTIQLLESIDQ